MFNQFLKTIVLKIIPKIKIFEKFKFLLIGFLEILVVMNIYLRCLSAPLLKIELKTIQNRFRESELCQR